MSQVSPRRCPFSRKPEILGEIHFYRCPNCLRVLYELTWEEKGAPACCGAPMQELAPAPAPDAFSYEIGGGFDNGAVSVNWAETKPDWLLLRTFTSAIFRLIAPKKASPAIFPLADEDAYVYCGRDKCQKCMYKCKKGFVIYIYANSVLYALPMQEMAKYFKVVS